MIALLVILGLAVWLVLLAVFVWVWKVIGDVNARFDELSEAVIEEHTHPKGNVRRIDDYRNQMEL